MLVVLELLWDLRISNIVHAKVHQRNGLAMFGHALPERSQMRMPAAVRCQVLRSVFGEQNMASIAIIHHPLCQINCGSGNIWLFVNVRRYTDRASVDPHAQLQFGILFAARLISNAHSIGACRLEKKTSAIPSPVGSRTSLPAASASRNWLELPTTSFLRACSSRWSSINSLE